MMGMCVVFVYRCLKILTILCFAQQYPSTDTSKHVNDVEDVEDALLSSSDSEMMAKKSTSTTRKNVLLMILSMALFIGQCSCICFEKK